MSVLINFKICDNVSECAGIEVCPTGALFWDGKEKTIKIDNEKCNSCGLCEPACEVDAIFVAKDDKEHKKLEKKIADDPRKRSDLYIDRYGVMPIHPAFLIGEDRFEEEVLKSDKLMAVEFFNDDSIHCLLHGITVKKLFQGVDIEYRKLKLESQSLSDNYEVKELPALLFFKAGKLIGKIEGFFEKEDKERLLGEIKKVLK